MKRQVFNPYLPGWEYIPDGEPHVFGDRLYVFGSHDRAGGNDYCLNDYVAWSAPVEDLSEWHYEGIIFRKDQHPYKIGRNILFAPDVAQGADGKFYLYYSVADSSIISVAVCDTPAGQYEYFGDIHLQDGHVLGKDKKDWYQFDPAVLVDVDGRVWLYSGSGQKANEKLGHPVVGCFVMELAKDMVTVISEPKIILPAKDTRKEPNFFEGASIRHIGGLYYLVYPATDISGLNYATSRYPDRDFVYRGRIHSTSDIGLEGIDVNKARYPIGNNHGGLVCIKDQWYIFDHRMTNRTLFSRQGVAEPVTIAEDGKISMAESTSCGLNGGPLEGKGVYPAYIACNLMSRKILGFRNPMTAPCVTQDEPDYSPEDSNTKEPVPYISRIKKGCLIGFKYFDMKDAEEIMLSIRGQAEGKIMVQLQEESSVVGEADFKVNSNLWEKVGVKVRIPRGKQALYFTFKGKGTFDMLSFEIR